MHNLQRQFKTRKIDLIVNDLPMYIHLQNSCKTYEFGSIVHF